MNAETLAVINQKGGVGKTTLTVNLGHALALAGHRVLLVDMDPQGHLATCLGLFRQPSQGVDEVLLNGADMTQLTLSSRDGLWLLPSGARLERVEQIHEGGAARARRLSDALQRTELNYDYILFDCPPMFGLLMANVLMAVDRGIIPVGGDYLSLNGLAKLLATVKRFEPFRGKGLDLWVVLSRFHPRRRISREVIARLAKHMPKRVLATAIKESTVLTECPSMGRTIFEYRNKSAAAEEFIQLAQDLLQRRILQ
ncbi:MAG: ParA family protein [Gammaproteobacteria bacterium SHHR-1]|uniref:ParA family protein n=1 Tax=Magnetovirga frankeli TaxID=947516 RepID=UPI001292E854|nr:ParA family protein [gamma proteobacterium SS-5]